MRVDFVGHASLLVQHGALKLLTDPWWSGPAYAGQWYPYPLPVPERYDLRQVDAIYISHAHEDHLHAATLREVLQAAPTAQAIIPRRYDTQMRDYLRRIGFQRIREVQSGSPFTLRKRSSTMRLTVMTHLDDSLLAVEANGTVLINANDALHASRRDLIDEYCRILRRRFPRIDYLFCAYGGASYFPNCFHVPGKDDRAVANAREAFFLHNFALIAHHLRPIRAFPFAAHFVLPDERTWWISALRLESEPPSRTVRRFLGETSTAVHDLQPGDFVADHQVYASPPPVRERVDQAREDVLARYPKHHERQALAPAEFEGFVDAVRSSIARHAIAPSERLNAVVVLWDLPTHAIRILIDHGHTDVVGIDRGEVARYDPEVVFETHSDLLKRTMRSPFGRDLISVGYGAEVRIRSQEDFQNAKYEQLLSLLAPPQPRWRQRLLEHPVRTLGFVLGDASMRYALASRLFDRLRRRHQTFNEPGLYEIRDWALMAQTPE
jgi:glyoxylase-like metal-dependent hydrolase (beta-lactamase superfamily II)